MISPIQLDDEATIDLRGECMTLLPEKAMYWQERKTLLVADPHWGKAATFRAEGIPVPSGTTMESVSRLSAITIRTGAKRIVFLGDLLHAKSGRSHSMFEALEMWRDAHSDIEVVLVRGNHDRSAGDPPAELRIECVSAPYRDGPFVLAHHPVAAESYVIAGHVHPGIRLYGAGGQRERLSCFYFGRDTAVLPAFGEFTGLANVAPAPGDSVYAIAEDKVLRVY